MKTPTSHHHHHHRLLLLLLLIAAGTCKIYQFADASPRKVHIPDELDDVVDDEEDDDWREWGKPKKQPEFDPPPMDFANMGLQGMQDAMMKRQMGPVFGFVKLRLGAPRTPEMVSEIAMKWTKVARTGAIEAKFTGVDVSTIMFTMQKGQDILESFDLVGLTAPHIPLVYPGIVKANPSCNEYIPLKDFLLSQPEAYEIKIGDQLFRRPGDPSFEEVFEKLRAEKSEDDDANSMKGERHHEL